MVANVAGIAQIGRVEDITDDEWHRVLDVNLTGPFLVCRAALPHLRATRGCIVNIASIAGLEGQAYTAAYCASKGGLVLLTRALAVELALDGVRVNCVCPAGVDTPLMLEVAERIPPGLDPRLFDRLQMLMPGLITAGEVADAVAYLASDAARNDHGPRAHDRRRPQRLGVVASPGDRRVRRSGRDGANGRCGASRGGRTSIPSARSRGRRRRVEADDVTLAEQDFAAVSGALDGEHVAIVDPVGRVGEWQWCACSQESCQTVGMTPAAPTFPPSDIPTLPPPRREGHLVAAILGLARGGLRARHRPRGLRARPLRVRQPLVPVPRHRRRRLHRAR